MPSCIRLLGLVLVAATTLAAASWESLNTLRPGDHVRVIDNAGQRHTGEFQSVSAEAIRLKYANGEVAVERAQVRRVQVRRGSHRARNIAIGAGIGAAVGVTADATLGAYLRNESNESGGARALTYLAPIVLFGAIGAAMSSYKTIYAP